MRLYEIDEAIEACIDTETGEVIDAEKLDALQMEKSTKIRNIALFIKNLKSDEEALKAEKEMFDERAKAAKRKRESLEAYLAGYLNGEKVTTTEFKITWRKAPATDVFNEDLVPAAYKIPQPAKLDRAEILRVLKSGADIPGTRLIMRDHMTVK